MRRLPDRIRPGVRVLFVGINPGLRSSAIGHHFAGYSNRFWKLLYDSGLVPHPLTCEEDVRLPEWGYGLTNLVARPSACMDELGPGEFRAGRRRLLAKIRRVRPKVAVLVGVTVYRSLFSSRGKVRSGLQRERLARVRVFVLPNPSGRNANYSYQQMLAAYRALRSYLRKAPTPSHPEHHAPLTLFSPQNIS